MLETIGVGIVGTGIIFQRHAEACAQLVPRSRLVAVADIDAAKLERARVQYAVPFAYADHRQLLELGDVGLVIVCTPPAFHEQVVCDALEAGKYVVCEKPLAHTLESADRIRKVAERFPGRLSTTFQFRYLPEVRRTIWLRDQQLLGRLLFGRFSWCGRFQKPGRPRMEWWGRFEVAGGGAVMTQLIHQIDLMSHIFGAPMEVSAVVDRLKEPIESEDTCAATIRFESGAIASCYSTMSAQRFDQAFDVFGSLASAHQPWALECMDEAWRRHALNGALAVVPPTVPEAANPHVPYLEAVLDAIESGRPLPIGPDEAAVSLEVCAGIYASSQLGRPVSLPLNRADHVCRGIAASDFNWHQAGRSPAVSAGAAADSTFESIRGARA